MSKLAGLMGILLLVGACSSEDCRPNDRTICLEGVAYWVDSCGNQGDKAGDCECGCNVDFTACKDPCECEPDCEGKQCGPDGCQGSCPPGCQPGETCNQGICEGECVPDCAGKCCGGDGCQGTCPDNCADTDQTCNFSTCQCEGNCTPDCTGRECGSDGCGGECGACDAYFACEDGICVCPNVTCGQECCAPGEICDGGSCCLADCAGKQCGTNCAGESCGQCGQGYFCNPEEHTCIYEGIGECWTGSLCPGQNPYCFMSCETMENKCCDIPPDHPLTIDGTLVDTCEVCCTNPQYPNPVLWPDNDASCCAEPSPYPYYPCGQDQRMCCSVVAGHPHRCDGTTDTSCQACCGGNYPVAVIFPDGHTSCCNESHPWPCVQGGNNGCCEEPGQCG